jgi:hypothetical protein
MFESTINSPESMTLHFTLSKDITPIRKKGQIKDKRLNLSTNKERSLSI